MLLDSLPFRRFGSVVLNGQEDVCVFGGFDILDDRCRGSVDSGAFYQVGYPVVGYGFSDALGESFEHHPQGGLIADPASDDYVVQQDFLIQVVQPPSLVLEKHELRESSPQEILGEHFHDLESLRTVFPSLAKHNAL